MPNLKSFNTLVFFLLILFSYFTYGQQQNNYWNFGFNCMVDFSGAQPNGMTTSAIFSPEQWQLFQMSQQVKCSFTMMAQVFGIN
jgi:hypothetical protein